MSNMELRLIYTDPRLTRTHLRILLCLLDNIELNQARIAELLCIKRQNINKATLELFDFGYLTVSRVEGRSKFYKLDIKDFIHPR